MFEQYEDVAFPPRFPYGLAKGIVSILAQVHLLTLSLPFLLLLPPHSQHFTGKHPFRDANVTSQNCGKA